MNLIVAVTTNKAIGSNGDQLFFIPEDLRFFKEKTNGKVVVMGRSTLKTLPNGKPLKDRTNIVLSRNADIKIEGAFICKNLPELFKELKKYNSDDVYVIGGESVYEQLADYCSTAYITEIDKVCEADKFFNCVYNHKNWIKNAESEEKEHEGKIFKFCIYKNLKPKKMSL